MPIISILSFARDHFNGFEDVDDIVDPATFDHERLGCFINGDFWDCVGMFRFNFRVSAHKVGTEYA